MVVVNLTPHDIVLRSPHGHDTVLPKSGQCARVVSTPGVQQIIPGVPCVVVSRDTAGAVTGMPDPSAGVLFIVSAVVGAAAGIAGVRKDVMVPGTGPGDGPVRNEEGHIVAVTRLKFV